MLFYYDVIIIKIMMIIIIIIVIIINIRCVDVVVRDGVDGRVSVRVVT